MLIVLLLFGCSSQEERIKNILILRTSIDDEEKRRAAADELGKIGVPAIPALIELMQPQYRHALDDIGLAFGRMGSSAIPDLIEALKHENPFVRGVCATALAAAGQESSGAVPELKRILDEDLDEPGVRLAAAIALGEIGPTAKPATSALLRATQNTDGTLRSQAIKSLKKIDPGSLGLIPIQANSGNGSNENNGNAVEWMRRQSLLEIGRLEYGRFDLNDDWKLSFDEIKSTDIYEHLLNSECPASVGT